MGNETQWAYDSNGRMTTLTEPNGSTATYVYDHDNELIDTTDEDGRRTTYSYDSDGNQTGETWVGSSPAEKVTYTYDADNELTGAVDAYATLTFAYNNDGRLSTDTTSGPGTGQPAVTLTYSYDQLGDETERHRQPVEPGHYDVHLRRRQNMTAISTSYGGTEGPQVQYTYDEANRLTFVSRIREQRFGHQHDLRLRQRQSRCYNHPWLRRIQHVHGQLDRYPDRDLRLQR